MIILFEAIVVIALGLGVFSGVTAGVSSHLRNKRAFQLGKNLQAYDPVKFKVSKRARESYLRGVREDATLTTFGGEEWATAEDFGNIDPEALMEHKRAREDALKVLGDSYDQFR